MAEKPEQQDPRIAISGYMDRHGAEALQLELRRLAKRYGVDVKEITIDRPDE